MFPNNLMRPGIIGKLTIPKILGGISKTLNVINQAIPIYQQAKPAIKKGKNLLNVVKNINITTDSKNNNSIKNYSETYSKDNHYNTPTFFQ